MDEWNELREDDKVWMVEFYSTMCGACQEFEPELEKIVKALPEVSFARVSIDNSDGAQIAERTGVFDEAVPNIRLLHSKTDFKGASIYQGDEIPATAIISKLKSSLSGTADLQDGKYVKRS
eukprot:CAMPEP_0117734320 /NCGR_PEP_ID=MMETSP0947-20121206/595_1 /TAXON_ID=44440 /ORGANISM="Chattonella subsalsa, Strain CCMP2191" /LENGTH=120 /DNA_ID=CAMNT_0005549059 /DNA_START=201 /DNA_END=563 /DNA_ORIENTATION=-